MGTITEDMALVDQWTEDTRFSDDAGPPPPEVADAMARIREADTQGERTFQELQERGEIPEGAHYYGPSDEGVKYFTQQEYENLTSFGKGFVEQAETRKTAESAISQYKTDDGYNIAKALADGVSESTLKQAGFTQGQLDAQGDAVAYERAAPETKFKILQERGTIPKDAKLEKVEADGGISYSLPGEETKTLETKKLPWYKSVWRGMTPWEEEKGERATARGIGIMAAEQLVPGVYTARHWKDMGSGGEKAFAIGLDVVITAATVIPVAGAAARGARTAASIGRAARLAAAAKGVGREAVAQLRAPVDIVVHPVATTKAGARNLLNTVENLAHHRKIPIAVLTTTEGTVRLPIKATASPKEAMQAGDALMARVAKGEKPVVEINGNRFELTQSPFMQEVGGGVVHSTPQGESFLKGATVEIKPGMPASEQGLFVANQPLPRFASSSAFGKGGEKPSFLIMPPEMARKAVPTGKIYAGTKELELKFPVGTKIPPPRQHLFTRIGTDGQRVEMLLWKPLTPKQIVKMKSLAIVEDIKAPFTPALLKGGKEIDNLQAMRGLSKSETRALARELTRAGNGRVADNLLRAYGLSRVRDIPGLLRRAPPSVRDLVGERVAAKYTEGARAASRIESQRIPARERDAARLSERAERARFEADRTTARIERIDGREGRVTPPTRTERVMPPRTRITPPPRRIEPPPPRPPRVPPPRPPQTPPPRVPPPPHEDTPPIKPPIDLPEGGKSIRPWTKEDIASAVAWRQGFGWWAVRSPYQNDDWKYFMPKNLPDGIKTYADRKTAFATIQRYKGPELREPIKKDLGIVDVLIRRPRRSPGAMGAIKFLRDRSSFPGQSRRARPRRGMVSVLKNRVYHTNVRGRTLLSSRPLGRVRRG